MYYCKNGSLYPIKTRIRKEWGYFMKTLHKKYGIGRLVSFVLAFCMIFTMVPSAVFADDTTQTIYIGGNKLTVPLEEASYWKYNEADGTITQCSSDADANVLINTVGKYGTPTSSIYVNLVNVNIIWNLCKNRCYTV